MTRYLESVGVKLPKGGLYIHSGLFLFGWYSRHLAAKFKSMTKTAEIEKWARERGLLKFNETLF